MFRTADKDLTPLSLGLLVVTIFLSLEPFKIFEDFVLWDLKAPPENAALSPETGLPP